jgi:hypothetical protein
MNNNESLEKFVFGNVKEEPRFRRHRSQVYIGPGEKIRDQRELNQM